jgi:hypothetical protein
MVISIFIIFIMNIPWVIVIPWVSYDTVTNTVRYVPVPETGTVYAGTGMVLKFPTRGIPVTSPICKKVQIITVNESLGEGFHRGTKWEDERNVLEAIGVILHRHDNTE